MPRLPRVCASLGTLPSLAGLIALALTLAGCGSSKSFDYALDVAPTTGLLAVDVENFSGSVEVRVTPRNQKAGVYAFASVDASADEATRAQILEAIRVTAELEDQGARSVLRVRSTSAHTGAQDHRVSLQIRVPRCDGLRVDNKGGLVVAVGTAGATDITNRFGAIELRTDKPITEPVTLTNVDANIYYQVPAESSGAFDLATLDGFVMYRARVGSSDQTYGTTSVYQARLNGGTTPVVARTNKGDVLVWVDKDPVAITRLFKRTFPDPAELMFLKGSRRFTRNLPEDHAEVTGPNRDTGMMFYD